MKAPLPDDEKQRIESLLEYKILDTPSEAAFDDLTRLASYICGTPIALISLVDTNRQWFKSKVGLDALETPRDIAFCAHAILQPDVFIVPDATDDERFATNPLVISEPNVRFYAGVPLTNALGYSVGTLCVIDQIPRNLSPEQVEALRILGRQVIKQMELRRNLASLVLVTKERKEKQKLRQQFFQRVAGGFGLASVILVLIGVVSDHSTKVLINTTNQVKRTQEKIHHLEELLSHIKDAETGQRGYILTGQQSYLKPYQVALTKVNPEIEELRNLAAAQSQQQQRLDALKLLVDAKFTEIKQTIDLRQRQGLEAALQLIRTNKGQSLMDDIRKVIREMETEEKELLQQQSQAATASANNTIWIIAIAIGSGFLTLAVVYYLIYGEVTARKLIEDTLNEERNFISAVLDTASALVIVLDAQGQIVRFNQACEQTTGYSFDEVRGRYFWNIFVLPEEVEPAKAVFQQLQNGVSAKDYENYWVTKDGSRRLIAWSNTILKDEEGNVEYIIATGIDITARKRAEQHLAAEYATTSALAESLTIQEATNRILQGIGENLILDWGEIWLVDESANVLRCLNTWYKASSKLQEFAVVTQQMTFALGVGLPGCVWASGEPVWLSDVMNDDKFLRVEVAAQLGLHTAFAFPICSGNQTIGVMAFFQQRIQPQDADLLRIMTSLGNQVGQFIKRKQAEEQLLESQNRLQLVNNILTESEQRWQLALRGNSDGIWDWNVKTNEVFFSTRWKEMLGYAEQEISHHVEEWSKRVHPDDLAWVTQLIQDHFAKKTPFYISEHRMLCKDGTYKWILDRGQALWDEAGNPVRMAGSHTDITERKRVEESLERERRQLQEIITSAPVAMAMFDTEMRYLAYSNKWLTDYGIQEQSIINRSHYEVFPDIPEHWKAIHQLALQGEAISNPEDVFYRENGSKIYLRWAIHPWLNHNDQVGGIIMVTDVINELVEAREAAVEASQFKSRFLANMSHEIRTPMNAVLGMTGLLLETTLNSEQRDFVETIRISGDALLSLINEILDLSKLEAGEMMLEILEFDLSTCFEEVLDLLAPQAHNKGLEIAALIYRNVPTQLLGDASRLRQILVNLISNAIKFSSSGEVVVRAELRTHSSTTATIRFTVTDTGVGIAPEDQGKLFTPFIQVDASTTRKYGGTGLGLAICKQLVTLMGGEIGVESQIGEGSKFWFEMTFAKQQKPNSVIRDRGVLNNRRLLVVDDNATNRKIIYHQATRWGMRVDTADCAAAGIIALEQACEQKQPYDIALIDMQMPDTDGITLGTQIKANSAIANIPLIMLTSSNLRDEVQQAQQIGFAAYLVKPVKPSRLLDTIMTNLETQPKPDNSDALSVTNFSKCPRITQTNNSDKSPLRIILAEDNLVNQKVALKQLQSLGYSADVAANGQEVLQLLATIPYDLILMDCQMPILDGLDTTKEIHRWQESAFASRRRPVVVAMTANAMKEDKQMCLDAGMDDYLSKPVIKEKLAAVLKHWESEILKTQAAKPTTTDNDLPNLAINWEYLHQLSENNPEFEFELLQIFVEDSKFHLELTKAAIDNNDFQRVAQEAHHLKGASANVGATTMQQAAEQLEQLAHQQERRGTAKLINELAEFINQIQAFLIAIQNQ
ncbi:multi-sensor hybrid histidine kinase [Calothrix sp. NIES-2100]|uniref:PAS domain S-box protein n=1 Tax=Calothrix sp. NIES-2100 TaxID=1954172 RepID=UPI000B5FB72D|nr:multi-sensor hybrid histidine kinase [Calothrix sp. NIES-2100]